jgi:hypothetical protein
MNTAKHHLLGNSYAVTVLYLSLFFLFCTTTLWGQSHRTNLADNSRSFYNLNSYPKVKKVSIESWKKYNDPKDYSHPDFGLDMSNKPCESCVEVLQKRTENSRYYINTEEPSEFFVTQSLNPINYKVNGYLMAMDAHLFDKGNGIHENRFFVQKTGVNTMTKNTYLNTDQGKLKFNKWTLWTRKNGIETLVGTANWENYTIGEEGMYIKNIFKGIDAEMIVGNGKIKTNFIMSSNLYGVYDELIFRDEIVINNSPVSISFKDGSSSLEGMGRIVIKNNENLAELNSAVIYPEGYVQEDSQIAMYSIKQNSLGVVVPYRWITENIKKTRLIIDPEFTGTGTLNWINILGSMYNASCSFINSCDYNINVVQPAATTVTDLYFNFGYKAVETSICWKNDGGFKITYGGCAYPSNSTVAFCPNDGFKGECYADNLSLLNTIQSCITTTSCVQRTLPFVLKMYRKCKGNIGCDYDCIDAARDLLITLKGRTVELPPAPSGGINLTSTSICAGQSMPVSTNGVQYGVPPYTYNWSFNASGTPSLATTTNPNITFPTAGTQTVYLTVTDNCGRTVTINRNVTVNASVTPAVTITANPSGAICPGTSVTFTANPTNGGTPVYQWKRNGTNVGTNSATYTNATLANGDVITVTMTSSLGCSGGAVTSAPYTVTVAANSQPVPNIASLPNSTGQCSVTVTTIPKATNPCTGQVINATTTSPLTYTNPGTYTITWNYVDASGNTASQTQTVIVADTTNPVPNVATLPNITGACSVTVTNRPTATDNCSGAITATTTSPLTYTTAGTHTITWTYTDAAGNTASQTQQVIIADTVKPVPNVTTLPTITGQCSVTVTTIPTATDNCSGTITATTTSPLTYTANGTYTITWKYTDAAGNTQNQTQQVQVTDNIPPVPNVTLLPNISAQCNATVTTIPTATDNCSGAITATTTSPLIYNTQGTYTIVWKYTDASGNDVTQNQQVIINDTTNPVPNVATLPALSSACSITATAPTATDNCSGILTATTTDPLTYSTPGTYTIVWKYTDAKGNITTQNQSVIIGSNTPPVPNMAALPAITGSCSVTVTAIPKATDSCGNTINGVTTQPLTYNTVGNYTITWTFTDALGNSVTQTQIVNVVLAGSPTPSVASLPTITQNCSATITTIPTATDGCGNTITATTTSPLTYTSNGTYTIIWAYTDMFNVTTTQNQTVIINDNLAPVPAVATLAPLAGDCAITVTTIPTAIDNCAGTITATTTDPLTYTVDGTYTITWIYNDGRGNTSSQTQQVIVRDVNAPVPAITNLPAINGQCTVTVTNRPTAIDTCAGNITATTTDPLTYNAPGTYTITWTYDDGSGNVSNQTQQVIIQDTTNPVAITRSVIVNLDTNGQATITPTQVNNNSTDNCGIASIQLDRTALTCADLGTTTVTLIVTDNAGNIGTAPATITVVDAIRPVANTQPVTLHLNANGEITLDPAQVENNSTDNCAIVTRTVSQSLFNCSHIGTNTIQYTVTDASGNSDTKNVVVTIVETVPPVAVAYPQVAIPLEADGRAALTVDLVNNGSTDNCAIATITLSKYFFQCSEVGTHTVTMTVTDRAGNTTTTTTQVTVLPIPAPTTPYPTQEFCIAENAIIADIFVNESNIVWYANATTTQTIPANTLVQNGTYYAALQLATCIGVDRLPVTVQLIDTPAPTITEPVKICRNLTTTLAELPINGNNIVWYRSLVGGTPVSSTTPVYDGDIYYASQDDGICESSDRLQVIIASHYCDIIIYNAVSANNDGKNDYFIIEGLQAFPKHNVEIFNQWGISVFQTNNYGPRGYVFEGIATKGLATDGQTLLPFGTYYYVIEYQNQEGVQVQKTGYLHLTH